MRSCQKEKQTFAKERTADGKHGISKARTTQGNPSMLRFMARPIQKPKKSAENAWPHFHQNEGRILVFRSYMKSG